MSPSTLLEQVAEGRLELAQGKHTPTKAMQVVAKRGVRMSAGRELDPAAVAVGRKVAAGQKLSDSHVEHMAAYHSTCEGCPTSPTGMDDTSVEHMLWAGAPGANWSGARMAALDANDVSTLSEDAVPMLQLDQEGKGVSLEVFVRDGMGEPTTVDKDNDLIWAPILRSGMLAMRPGPNGEKVDKPLVFVSGKASDPRKEIGLENLLNSFNDRAIQHVTIPTRHENDVLDNTGFIKGMKIVESKKFPGEKVLVGAHDFRDPDVRRKVELGTIANRSCGIVYDYVNTETGKKYEQAVDHVALTNRPWVTGMTAYGDLGTEEFAGREVVPMLLSEDPNKPAPVELAEPTDLPFDDSKDRFKDNEWARSCVMDAGEGEPKDRFSLPIREPDGTLNTNAVREAGEKVAPLKGVSLAQKKSAARSLIAAHVKVGATPPDNLVNIVKASTKLSEAERAELKLSDVQWGGDDELSLNDIQGQVSDHLSGLTQPEEFYPYWSVHDVTPTKALVKCCYGGYGDDATPDDHWVIPLETDGNQVQLSDFSQWTPVTKEWVTDDDAAKEKQEVGSIAGLSEPAAQTETLELATLNAKARAALPASDFVFPATREYPIHDLAHGKNALSRGAANETGKRLATIKRKVYARYPELKSGSTTKTSLAVSDPLNKGGAMPPTVQQALERLSLSEEALAVIQPMLSENESLKTALADVTAETRKSTVAARVKELEGSNFPPGFCRRYEEIALGDDGEVAAVLMLSEDGKVGAQREYTATEIADSLIAALPVDESGKVALADRSNLLTSPIAERPPVSAADQAKVEGTDNHPQTADEWITAANLVAPGVADGLKLSSDKKEG